MTSAIPEAPYEAVILDARVYASPGEIAAGDAIGIRQGAIVAVAARRAVERGIAASTRVLDLGGRTVLPAFIDSHTHFHRGAVLQRLYLDFETLRPASIEDVLEAVRDRAATLAEGEWVQGDSLSAPRLAEGRLPDRHELDVASPGHAVVLRGIGKHVVAANSAALAAAGIDRDTPDPPGGRIERDARGEPTGILHERAKLRLDQSHPQTPVPRPSAAARREALRHAFADLHRAGISTIHEMVRLPEEADDFAALHAEHELAVRVRLYYRVHESPLSLDWLVGLGIRRGLGDDWLRILGVKVSVDGFCIFRNAAVYEPYLGEPENVGLLRIEPARLEEIVVGANRQGLNVALHAVGARAVDIALDAFEAASPALAGPHRLEHAYVDVDEARLRRAQALGVAWSVQPGFVSAYGAEWIAAFGLERSARLMPLLEGAGVGLPMLFNSDFPCAPIGPLAAIGIAAERLAGGRSDGAARRASLIAAWRAFTTTPASVACDSRLGRIAIGSQADLIVLDEDPFAGGRLPTDGVRGTMVDGVMVHGAPDIGG